MKKRKSNGFWVYNPTYRMKIWCIFKRLETGVLHLSYVVPNHQFGYTTLKTPEVQFMGVKDRGKTMLVTYHVHPCAMVYKGHPWCFRIPHEVAQELFVKRMTPIILN